MKNTTAFSRPEFLVLLGVVLMALSLFFPSWIAIRQRQRLVMARADVEKIRAAGHRFFREYGVWPSGRTGEMGDARYGKGLSNAEVMNALRAVDGLGNPGHTANAQRIAFLEAGTYAKDRSGINEQGEFIDPWGKQYQVAMDTDLDNVCAVTESIYGRLIGEGIAIWSYGADRMPDTTDDILSWKQAKVIQTAD